MAIIERSALVLYPPDRMFELVQDVERYPEFLSWCTGSRVLEQAPERQIASLRLKVAGMETAFITENRLFPHERLEMSLKDGPFSQLEGMWQFKGLGDVGSKITLSLAFEFNQRWLAAAFSQGFIRVADRLVDDFCRRADEVLGD
ncbi:MAG: type II toxin-antitoxin system RatA family toxin [Wenzhouxiangellaceae bacterium]